MLIYEHIYEVHECLLPSKDFLWHSRDAQQNRHHVKKLGCRNQREREREKEKILCDVKRKIMKTMLSSNRGQLLTEHIMLLVYLRQESNFFIQEVFKQM